MKEVKTIKILHLPIKRKWLEMIIDGKKLEEYRDIKEYWTKRFYYDDWTVFIDCPIQYEKCYDIIEFRAGYGKKVLTAQVVFEGITVKYGKPKWGAPDYLVYAIKLGRVVTIKNRW